MTPMDFMARRALLIPPPNIPTVRSHGVFAPRSSWHARLTPKPPEKAAKPKPCVEHAPGPAALRALASPALAPAPLPAPAPAPAPALPSAPPSPSAPSLAHAEPAVRVESTRLSVAPWGRLLDGELVATSRYVEGAVLMKRTWGLNLLACPSCARKMRVLSTLTDLATLRRILTPRGGRADPLPRPPAPDPTGARAAGGEGVWVRGGRGGSHG
jgi:Putative transposase